MLASTARFRSIHFRCRIIVLNFFFFFAEFPNDKILTYIICCLHIILKTYCHQNVEIYACRFRLDRNVDYFNVLNLFSLLADKIVQNTGNRKNEPNALVFGHEKKSADKTY